MDLKKVEKLMELMRRNGVNEVEVDDKGSKVRIVFGGGVALSTPAPLSYAPMNFADTSDDAPVTSAVSAADRRNLKEVRSPFVGTYYASPSPDSDPFVRVGQRVKKGDVLCIIEAMKLMNEIEAETDGVIAEILVKNEEPVEFDRVLFLIE